LGGVLVYGHTGVVGAQLYRWLDEHGTAGLGGIALDRKDGVVDAQPDWVFVCVPTPTTDAGQDLSAVESVLAHHAGQRCAVVIRSTVLPGTCDRIQAEHPEWTVYHWPEFLNARDAWHDFCHPNAQVIGCYGAARSAHWHTHMAMCLPRPDSGAWIDTSLAGAECIKYAHNVHGAMQVVFANLVYDMCARVGVNWKPIVWHLTDLGHVGHETASAYWDVWRDNKRGYAGACFPKDVQALLAFMGDEGELLEGMERANARLLAVKR
jgi:UDP-glucose 6-dehydrogenase